MQAMSSVYTLTDQTVHPFSGQPMPKKEHQRLMTSLLAGILVIAVIIGVWYWISVVSNPPVTPTAGPWRMRCGERICWSDSRPKGPLPQNSCC